MTTGHWQRLIWATSLMLAPCLGVGPVAAQGKPSQTSPEGPTGKVTQPIIAGDTVSPETQQALGLVTVGARCSGTLVNRFWVLTADHCVSTNGTRGGPLDALSNLMITASWSTRTPTPTRVVRYFSNNQRDVALIYLGAGDFGQANIQLFFVEAAETTLRMRAYGRGVSAYATGSGATAVPAVRDGLYRSADFTPSSASAASYSFSTNARGQIIAGGDSGGPDVVLAPNGVSLGIVGVHSTAQGIATAAGKPTGVPPWTWVTSISSSTSAALTDIRFDIVQVIQEGRTPCPVAWASCGVTETSSQLLLLK